MKKLKVLVATIALLAATTAASAVDTAWFTLEGASGDAVASQQGSGLALTVTKGVADQTLTIGYNLTSSTGLLAGWAIDISATASVGKTVDVTGFTRLGAGYNTPTGGALGSLLTGSFDVGNVALPPVGAVGLVLTFDVFITGKTVGSKIDIFGGFGTSEQFLSNGYVWDGTVGPNANSVYGYAGTSWGNLPVITINNIPEPATLALLGLGVVALIRRRR